MKPQATPITAKPHAAARNMSAKSAPVNDETAPDQEWEPQELHVWELSLEDARAFARALVEDRGPNLKLIEAARKAKAFMKP